MRLLRVVVFPQPFLYFYGIFFLGIGLKYNLKYGMGLGWGGWFLLRKFFFFNFTLLILFLEMVFDAFSPRRTSVLRPPMNGEAFALSTSLFLFYFTVRGGGLEGWGRTLLRCLTST